MPCKLLSRLAFSRRNRIVLPLLWVFALTMGLLMVVPLLTAASRPVIEKPQYVWNLPPDFPVPYVPEDNPMSAAKVQLGRYLFYDKRISINGTQSCGSCHQQAHAFADTKPVAIGATGQSHIRSGPSLANIAYEPALTWANPNMRQLEDQALVPMFGNRPVELGVRAEDFVKLISSDPVYAPLFHDAFPGESEIFTIKNVVKAIASFERTLISGSSAYDLYHSGRDVSAMSEAALRGEKLFFSERIGCSKCHNGFTFAGEARFQGHLAVEPKFYNIGLYNINGPFSYPKENPGLYQVTGRPEDIGKFRVPTLRNVTVTAPYMHDGSVLTLGGVLDMYITAGRTVFSGPLFGEGPKNPNKSRMLRPFLLTAQQYDDLIEFLRSLTDEEFLADPRFSDPWEREQSRSPSRVRTP
jgi:cytochrome c peroxidase